MPGATFTSNPFSKSKHFLHLTKTIGILIELGLFGHKGEEIYAVHLTLILVRVYDMK